MAHAAVIVLLFSTTANFVAAKVEYSFLRNDGDNRVHSKILTEAVPANERRRRLNGNSDASAQEEILKSKQAVFLGKCCPDEPYVFPIGAGSGRGVVGSTEESSSTLNIIIDDGGTLDSFGPPTPGFFGLDSMLEDDLVSTPFVFQDVSDNGSLASVYCETATDIVIIYRVNEDADELGEVQAKATYRSIHRDGRMKNQVQVSLMGDVRAVKTIDSEGKINVLEHTEETPNSPSKLVQVVDATDEYIIADYDGASEILLISAEFKDDHGRTSFRTFIDRLKEVKSESNERRRMLTSNLQVGHVAINSDDDLEITLTNTLPFDSFMLYQVLLSVVPVDEVAPVAEPVADLETRAMLTGGEATLVVHGGWVRKKLYDLGVNEDDTESWDIILLDAHILDPEDGYRVAADLIDKNRSLLFHTTTEMSKLREQERRKGGRRLRREELLALSRNPSSEEHEISDDMKMGRRPVFVDDRRLENQVDRNASFRGFSNNGIIIVHGWCSKSHSFQLADFEGDGYEVYRFTDPDQNTLSPKARSWSHNSFALKLLDFTVNNRIGRCSNVAHSQGGIAGLHLYAFYWSCLDYVGEGTVLQSVGTPYRGTEIMNSFASVGEILGFGCGFLEDLSTRGAERWLSTTPAWARSQVTYYTTSFKDSSWWFSYDYCMLATDLFLDDPDDGVVENQRGQLPGGKDGILKRGWCHQDGMRDPNQLKDTARNRAMRDAAAH